MLAGVFDRIDELTGHLDELSSHWWFLLIVAVIAFLDSVVPIVPSETAVIIGGVAAGQGNQPIVAVIAVAAVGAFLGDTTAYQLGARLRGFVERRAARRATSQARLDWAKRQIRTRGGSLLITARFIPGGRTALTVASGVTHQPFAWFARWIAIAVVLWASYAGLLGYVFGTTFEDNHTAAFLVAFSCALGVTVLIEVVRHFRRKRAEQA